MQKCGAPKDNGVNCREMQRRADGPLFDGGRGSEGGPAACGGAAAMSGGPAGPTGPEFHDMELPRAEMRRAWT
jgi:hypothetical protein